MVGLEAASIPRVTVTSLLEDRTEMPSVNKNKLLVLIAGTAASINIAALEITQTSISQGMVEVADVGNSSYKK